MENIKVSVIIPAYNTQDYIDEMLECVVKQTYKNLEIIIINDGSKDDTLNHIEKYAERDSRIRYYDVPNGGVSNARNIGIKNCTGEKIFFWDSDDVVELDAIEKCIDFASKKGVSAVLYGYSDRIDGVNTEQHKSYLKEKYIADREKEELLSHFVGHSFEDINAWICKKEELEKVKNIQLCGE